MLVFYKVTDIERALKIMYPSKSILSKQTMIRYLKQTDPILVPEEWKKFEETKKMPSHFVTRDGIIVIVEAFNKGNREEVELEMLLELVDRIANGEEIDPANDIKTAYQRVKELEEELKKREEKEVELKRKLEEAIRRSNEIEHKNTMLLTDGKKKEEEYEKKLSAQQQYLIDIDKYERVLGEYNKVSWMMKKIKKLQPPEKPRLENYLK